MGGAVHGLMGYNQNMARPALSANRMMDILDLFGAFPGRSFTMSEIMRATDINVASCHAVLNALTSRGYLIRRDKSYYPGSALISVGQAAAQTRTLVTRSQAAAQALHKDLGVAVVLTALTGENILTLMSIPDAAGRRVSLRAGQRIPLVPPVGLQYLAWSSDGEVAAWIARGSTKDEATIAEWHRALAATRARGFLVTLQSQATTDLVMLMEKMATGTQPLDYKTQTSSLISDYGWMLEHPEIIELNRSYGVAYIAAPIFDREGHAVLSLGLGGFAEQLSGEQIGFFADRLMEICLRVTLEDRVP